MTRTPSTGVTCNFAQPLLRRRCKRTRELEDFYSGKIFRNFNSQYLRFEAVGSKTGWVVSFDQSRKYLSLGRSEHMQSVEIFEFLMLLNVHIILSRSQKIMHCDSLLLVYVRGSFCYATDGTFGERRARLSGQVGDGRPTLLSSASITISFRPGSNFAFYMCQVLVKN